MRARILSRLLLGIPLAGLMLYGAGNAVPPNSPPDAAADLFSGRAVRHISLSIGAAELAELRRSPRGYVRATVTEGNARFPDVAVHLKGATGSFRPIDDKPGLTLSFDAVLPAQRFHGLRKIHLNNSVEDRSYLSELLCSDLFRAAGVPAPRVAHAVVELNGKRLGMYVLKEGFTEDFLGRYFPGAHGRLYEPGKGRDVGEELDEKLRHGSPGGPGLAALAAAVQEQNIAARWGRLTNALDIDEFISFLAMEMLIGHRDGYALSRNNFRIYEDLDTGRASFLPTGMDQMFGRAPDTLDPVMSGAVARAVTETPEGRVAYHRRLGVLLTNVYRPAAMQRRADEVAASLRREMSWREGLALDREVDGLKRQIEARHELVHRLFAQPPVRPVVFVDGVATPSGWRPMDLPIGGGMDETTVAGHRWFHILAGPRTSAEWQTTIILPPGRYRFEGSVRTRAVAPISFGRTQGVALRADKARSEAVLGTTTVQPLSVAFEVGHQQPVELRCEMRASAGEAWFDVASLRVVQLSVANPGTLRK